MGPKDAPRSAIDAKRGLKSTKSSRNRSDSPTPAPSAPEWKRKADARDERRKPVKQVEGATSPKSAFEMPKLKSSQGGESPVPAPKKESMSAWQRELKQKRKKPRKSVERVDGASEQLSYEKLMGMNEAELRETAEKYLSAERIEKCKFTGGFRSKTVDRILKKIKKQKAAGGERRRLSAHIERLARESARCQ